MSRSALADGIRHLRRQLAAQQANQESDEQLLHDFTTRRDDNAFAVLVRRHGPMVLHVCRRVLGHEHDAEDAFQATFLVLARKAASLRDKTSLAGFLHGTAYRTAMTAKRSAARRRKHEGILGTLTQPRSPANPADELLWSEVRELLDAEISCLSEPYRSVFVLCCLENVSQAEAGQRLGLKQRTVSNRLAEARKRLAERLARRGVELTAALAASTLAMPEASALSPLLMANTIRAALSEGTAGLVSAHVASLAESAVSAMMLTRMKIAAVMLLAVGLLGVATSGSLVFLYGQASGPLAVAPEPSAMHPEQPLPSAQAATNSKGPNNAPSEEDQTVEIAGTVVDPNGKSFPRAKIYFLARLRNMQTEPEPDFARVRTIADANGRFRFRVSRSQVQVSEDEETYWGQNTHPNAVVTAVGTGHGLGWAAIHKIDEAGQLTLKLARDDVPIRGRVVNLEGRAIQGAKVRVKLVMPMRTESLLPWLIAQQIQRNDRGVIWRFQGAVIYPEAAGLEKVVATDAEGRFQLHGIGRERVAELRFEGPTIETRSVFVLTRPAPTFEVGDRSPYPPLKNVYHGATFEHVAAPTVPIIGTIRDKDTGKPLAGIIIQPDIEWDPTASYLRTVSDKDGHYRLVGLPKKPTWIIRAYSGILQKDAHDRFTYTFPKKPSWIVRDNSGPGPSCVRLGKKVRSGIGLDPVRADFELKRGVLIHGRVRDKATGQPVQAEVRYHLFSEDRKYVEGAGNWEEGGPISARTSEDGSFSLVGLPGRGILAVTAWSAKTGLYMVGAGAEKIKGTNQDGVFPTYPFDCVPRHNHSLQEINPAKDAASVQCNVFLDRGKTVTGTILDPEGKPLTGVRMEGPWGAWWGPGTEQLKTSRFTVTAINPHMPQWVFFFHKEKRLGAALRLTGNEPKDFTVRLQPCATITGRIVDSEGRPRAGLMLVGELGLFQHRPTAGGINGERTDKTGRFRITGLIPGLKWPSVDVGEGGVQIGYLLRDAAFQAGEVKDLGDVQVNR